MRRRLPHASICAAVLLAGALLGAMPATATPRKHVLVPSMVSASIVGVSADHDRVLVSDGAMLVRVTLSTGAVLELGDAGVVSPG